MNQFKETYKQKQKQRDNYIKKISVINHSLGGGEVSKKSKHIEDCDFITMNDDEIFDFNNFIYKTIDF